MFSKMSTSDDLSFRPKIDLKQAKKIVKDIYGLIVINITELNGYDDLNFHVLVEENVNDNESIKQILTDGYVLKIINALDSKDREEYEAQSELLQFLNKNNIRCPQPVATKSKETSGTITLGSSTHLVRLFEFIPGEILHKLPNCETKVFYEVGILTARIDNVLQNFDHPAYRKQKKWCLGEAPDILNYLIAVGDAQKTFVRDVIEEFSNRVLTVQDNLAKGIIHGDINEHNLIVATNDNQVSLKALIDFGDTHYCCYLYELALAMTYVILLTNNIESGGYVLGGYSCFRIVTDEEFNLLKLCVMTRLCQSLVLGAFASSHDPDNKYLLSTAQRGWKLLYELASMSEQSVLASWKELSLRKF